MNTSPPTPPRTTEQPGAVKADCSMNHALRVGSAVTWCHSSSNGRSIGFATRRGKILEINNSTGWACVKYRGKLTWLPLERFREEGARTELTDMIAGPRAASPTTAPGSTVRPASERGTTG